MMASTGVTLSARAQRMLSAESAADLATWLCPDHRAQAAQLLVEGGRLAQEAAGLSYLSRHEDWLEDLRNPVATCSGYRSTVGPAVDS